MVFTWALKGLILTDAEPAAKTLSSSSLMASNRLKAYHCINLLAPLIANMMKLITCYKIDLKSDAHVMSISEKKSGHLAFIGEIRIGCYVYVIAMNYTINGFTFLPLY